AGNRGTCPWRTNPRDRDRSHDEEARVLGTPVRQGRQGQKEGRIGYDSAVELMPFRDITGHRQLLELIAQAAVRGTLPPSLIFAGPEGVGKRMAAVALAQL